MGIATTPPKEVQFMKALTSDSQASGFKLSLLHMLLNLYFVAQCNSLNQVLS